MYNADVRNREVMFVQSQHIQMNIYMKSLNMLFTSLNNRLRFLLCIHEEDMVLLSLHIHIRCLN